MSALGQELLTPFRIDRTRYYQMIDAGALGPDDKLELLDGQLVKKMTIGNRHRSCVNRLTMHFAQLGADRLTVQAQGPIQIDAYNEPEPDITLIRPEHARDGSDHATARDIFLVVEVADSSILRDRNVKLPLYARAGVAEFWLVDLNSSAVYVHRDPSGDAYGDVHRRSGSDLVAPLAFPEHAISVESLLR